MNDEELPNKLWPEPDLSYCIYYAVGYNLFKKCQKPTHREFLASQNDTRSFILFFI